MWLILLLLAIFTSVQTLSILDPFQRTYCSTWTQRNLGSPFSIDPQAHYPRWVLTAHKWKCTIKPLCFISNVHVHFTHSTIKVSKYYYFFISLLCGIFDHGWYEFQLKYWSLCFGFCKINVPDPASRDLWSHQPWHISWCNH